MSTRSRQTGVIEVRRLEQRAQFQAAQRLVGARVAWADDPTGPMMRVMAATVDGRVLVTGHDLAFAPHRFVVVEERPA